MSDNAILAKRNYLSTLMEVYSPSPNTPCLSVEYEGDENTPGVAKAMPGRRRLCPLEASCEGGSLGEGWVWAMALRQVQDKL